MHLRPLAYGFDSQYKDYQIYEFDWTKLTLTVVSFSHLDQHLDWFIAVHKQNIM